MHHQTVTWQQRILWVLTIDGVPHFFRTVMALKLSTQKRRQERSGRIHNNHSQQPQKGWGILAVKLGFKLDQQSNGKVYIWKLAHTYSPDYFLYILNTVKIGRPKTAIPYGFFGTRELFVLFQSCLYHFIQRFGSRYRWSREINYRVSRQCSANSSCHAHLSLPRSRLPDYLSHFPTKQTSIEEDIKAYAGKAKAFQSSWLKKSK